MSDSMMAFSSGVIVGAIIGVFLGVGLYYLIQRTTISIFKLRNEK